MQYSQDGYTYIVYVERDEPIMATLTDFCRKHQIENGQISGIGAVKEIELGAFNVPAKQYIRRELPEVYELVNFEGNVILKDEDPFIHAHVVLGNHEMHLTGGHLFEARVAAVGEFIVQKIHSHRQRNLDPKIGLATMCLFE